MVRTATRSRNSPPPPLHALPLLSGEGQAISLIPMPRTNLAAIFAYFVGVGITFMLCPRHASLPHDRQRTGYDSYTFTKQKSTKQVARSTG